VPDPFIGQVIDRRYRVDSLLSQGGMGCVYSATQLAIDRPVALKVLHGHVSRAESTLTRFRREARVLAAIRHPHIVGIIDFGELGPGRLFLIMEHLEGEPLSTLLRREGCLQPELVAEMMRQIACGLGRAHALGVIHRDLKPSNIFVSRYDNKPFVKILDFGIAKAVGDQDITMTDAVVGSPPYMSPEQATCQPVGPQSDLYSLGVVGYEMLTGRTPFNEDTPLGYMMAHACKPPNAITQKGVRLQGPLQQTILSLLSKEPWKRPESAQALADSLEACGAAPIDWAASKPLEQTIETTDRATPAPASQPEGGLRLFDSGEATGGAMPTQESQLEGEWRQSSPRLVGPPRRTRTWLAMGVLTVLAVGLGYLVWSRSDPGPPATRAELSPSVAANEPYAEDLPTSATEVRPANPPTAAEGPAMAEDVPTADLSDSQGAVALVDAPPTAEIAPLLRVTVKSRPAATLYRDGTKVGPTPVEVTWTSGASPPTVVLKAAGYQPLTETLAPNQDGTEVTLALKEIKKTTPLERPR
jgi:serine/threonine-protein kinase